MSTSRLYIAVGLFLVLLLQVNFVDASLQTPACALNCTLEILETAGCSISSSADIRDCLCSSNTLQYDLTFCVFTSCDKSDQIIASEIHRTEICAGVPHDSRIAEILRVEIILAVFTFPMIALRLLSRIWVARRVWWDDWMVIICAVFMIPNTAIPIYTVYIGFGEHVWDVPVQNVTRLDLLYWIATIFYALIQNIAKLSILFLYLRIFPTPTFRKLVQITFAFQLCHMIAFIFAVVFQCVPVQDYWNITAETKCMNVNATMRAGAFFSIFEDLVIMVLPISELYRLKLGLKKRIALCFMFAVGSFACVTSMVRLRYVWDYTLSLDGTWNDIDIVLWSDIETYVAVICSCLMCIRPLLVKAFPAVFSSTDPNSAGTKSTPSNTLRQKWGIKIGSKLGLSKMIKIDSNDSKMTRMEDVGQGVDESARTIIIQGNNESERSLHGIEMEERGGSPSTFGKSEIGYAVNAEDFILRGEQK